MSLDDLARATCAVYVDGRREGTGTLVAPAHVVTAAHVVRGEKPLTIRFRDGLVGEPIRVSRIDLPSESAELDIAVLSLDERLRERSTAGIEAPAPAALWPARRLPPNATTFGYPKTEGQTPRGVWRDRHRAAVCMGVESSSTGMMRAPLRATAGGRWRTGAQASWPASWWRVPRRAISTG
jgi:hypothetical protein